MVIRSRGFIAYGTLLGAVTIVGPRLATTAPEAIVDPARPVTPVHQPAHVVLDSNNTGRAAVSDPSTTQRRVREDIGRQDTGRKDTVREGTVARAPAADEPRPMWTASRMPNASCQVTLCMGDGDDRDAGANPELRALCAKLPGLVSDCSDDDGVAGEGVAQDGGESACFSAFDGFDLANASAALFKALDRNHDGVVDESDESCTVSLVGYAWGGMNIQEVARRYLQNPKVQPARARVDRMVVIDPYKPVLTETFDVPPGVQKFWEYRHSVAPATDCSRSAPLGPYLGKPPRCGPGTTCRDYDYSLSSASAFSTPFGNYLGADVGMCSIVHVAFEAAVHNVVVGDDYESAPLKQIALAAAL
ncbi:MAG: hypothetical protein H6729_07715 [Deltaproteobacteria bacterium]|nr:hypothetical protein [Deltaproteobacteria bacterium]